MVTNHRYEQQRAPVAESMKDSRLQHREGAMTSQNPRPDIYDPKTLAVMDHAFAAIWNQVRLAIGQKLLNLVADGMTR